LHEDNLSTGLPDHPPTARPGGDAADYHSPVSTAEHARRAAQASDHQADS